MLKTRISPSPSSIIETTSSSSLLKMHTLKDSGGVPVACQMLPSSLPIILDPLAMLAEADEIWSPAAPGGGHRLLLMVVDGSVLN